MIPDSIYCMKITQKRLYQIIREELMEGILARGGQKDNERLFKMLGIDDEEAAVMAAEQPQDDEEGTSPEESDKLRKRKEVFMQNAAYFIKDILATSIARKINFLMKTSGSKPSKKELIYSKVIANEVSELLNKVLDRVTEQQFMRAYAVTIGDAAGDDKKLRKQFSNYRLEEGPKLSKNGKKWLAPSVEKDAPSAIKASEIKLFLQVLKIKGEKLENIVKKGFSLAGPKLKIGGSAYNQLMMSTIRDIDKIIQSKIKAADQTMGESLKEGKENLQQMVNDFLPFAQKRMGFNEPPKVKFFDDEENAEKDFGYTAHYEPATKIITLYTSGRHNTDIIRSLSHELIHHTQNCRGDLENNNVTSEDYAQNDDHLRDMEKEAYLDGNLIMRDWQDSRRKELKESKKMVVRIMSPNRRK